MQNKRNAGPHFLSGGGELGLLIRTFDWSSTDMGIIDKWPHSLQTILRLLLASKQPMFVWWGTNLTQFYNDAYREILGDNGKHPQALGQQAEDCWGEIWTIIHPLILKVLSGIATCAEDELIPIFRNGKLEDVYWTFSYTPIHNDLGNIEGVLVICNETTKKVVRHQLLSRQVNLLLMQAPVAICTFYGKDLVIESVNEKMMALWGRSNLEKLVGIPLFEALPETAIQGFDKLLNNVFITGKPYVAQEQEVNLLHNGKLRQFFLKVMYQPLLDENGIVAGIMVLADDVTDTVTKRKRVAENELKARIAITSADFGTYQVNLITNKLTGNKRFYELSNLEPAADRNDFDTLLYPKDPKMRERLSKEAFVSGKLSYEKSILLKDKSLHWLRIYGKVVFDKCKNPVKILGVVDDITQDKLLTEEKNELLSRKIKESQRSQLFESVISHIKEGVLIIEILKDPHNGHKIIYCNNALEVISGYAKADIMGKPVDWINGAKGDPEEWQKFKESIVNKESYEFEWMGYKENREIFWNNMCISPVIDSDGNYTHCIAIIRDITVRKLKDKEINLAILHAQETERFQIGAELHDNVNQILAGTLMSLGMAKEKMTKKQNAQIAQSIEYLRMGIEEIRRISHWLAPIYHDKADLVDSFEKLFRDINRNKIFTIHFKHEGITNSNIHSTIQLNLYRILQEQMTNILKYSEASVIEVTLKKLNNEIHLNIEDNGIGMDTEKYQQGIGLNNIRKRAALLSGTFSLISSAGNGCKISVHIPLDKALMY